MVVLEYTPPFQADQVFTETLLYFRSVEAYPSRMFLHPVLMIQFVPFYSSLTVNRQLSIWHSFYLYWISKYALHTDSKSFLVIWRDKQNESMTTVLLL